MSEPIPGLGAPAPRDLLRTTLTKPGEVPPSKDPKTAAREFEGLLMAQLFQTLRKTVHHSGLFGDSGQARGTYEYLLDQAVVQQAMAAGKGWGLAERLERDWTARQEKTAVPPPK